jgi:phosphotransferase system enzyme I (PtsI)
MFPMVDSVETFRSAKAIYDDARTELTQLGTDFARDVAVGTMVETPAAAVLTDILADECDFFSIGTNDLTQYTHATDRGNAHVSRYFNDFSPAVLRLIRQTIDAAHEKNKPVSVCGELAGNPFAIPVLVGMGVDKLSMVSGAVPQAKWLLSRFTDADLEHIALRALTMATAADLLAYMTSVLQTHEAT